VLGPQLCCAAAELPLTEADVELFGGEPVRHVLDALVEAGALRTRPTGWYWTSRQRPDADIRGTGGEPVVVVENGTGRLLGTVDAGASHSTVHNGAVYIHRGEVYVVDELDLEQATALVHAEDPEWTTQAREVTDVAIVEELVSRSLGPITLGLAVVDVTSQVVSYLRRRLPGGEVIGETPLDLPERQLRTVAVYYTVDPAALADLGLRDRDIPGTLHAAEHAAIGLLPLVASCDRWDIGGLSTAAHPDTGLPTVFVYDGYAGGVGFAERGYTTAAHWLGATREAIMACGCDVGCPSCVQSPKCGNGNEPLDKAGAIAVLGLLLTHLEDDVPVASTGDSSTQD
jgi:DEAD/DEAH box helicase domain-containing protein